MIVSVVVENIVMMEAVDALMVVGKSQIQNIKISFKNMSCSGEMRNIAPLDLSSLWLVSLN